MVLFNYSTKELTAKIVYYGPGLCGKTTNLEFIYESLPEDKRGRMLSLSTQTDRTLYFDFLPVELGDIRGMKTRVQLYTVPGQVFYNETRRLVLKGVDGIVFVADSQSRVSEANIESFRNLEDNLKVHGLNLAEIPMVLQFNKRDLPDIKSVEEMNTELNRYNAPFYEVIATTGIGVHDTLKAISKLVLRSLTERYDGAEPQAARSPQATTSAHEDTLGSTAQVQETNLASAVSDAAAVSTAPENSPGNNDWEASELETELDQMDASEIQGLLEEVDCFDTEDADNNDRAALTSSTGEENLFNTPATDDTLADATLTDNDIKESAPWAAAAEATGFDVTEEEPASAPSTQAKGQEPHESLSGNAPEDEGDHAIWMGAPNEGEDNRLPGDLARPENGGGAAELSFENYMERNEALSPETDHVHEKPLEPAPAELPNDTPEAQQDLVTALPATGDGKPTLQPGMPVQDANGHLQVPIQLDVGGQQYTYILTLTLQPQADDPA